MKKVIAVSGASGFVGRILCPLLLERGHTVVELDRRRLWAEDLTGALAHSDVVIHLAARAHVLRETEPDPPGAYERSNLLLTQRLGLASQAARVSRFIFVSSAGVLGDVSPPDGFDDGSPPSPHDDYSRSKRAAECWLQSELSVRMSLAIVRPPLIYGPHARGNLMRLMRFALKGWPLPLGALTARRSLIGVRNLADLLASLSTCADVPQDPFLAADSETTSIAELYAAIARHAGHRVWLPHLPPWVVKAALAASGRGRDIARLTGPYWLRPGLVRQFLGWEAPRTQADELLWMVRSEWGRS